MVVRAVDWPRDPAAVARSLSDAPGWYWLDGAASEPDGTHGLSYLGTADTVRVADAAQPHGFLSAVRTTQRTAPDADNGWVLALSYEYGVTLMGEHAASDETDSAELAFAMRSDAVLVLDHATQLAHLRGETEADLDRWMRDHGSALHRTLPRQKRVNEQSRSPHLAWRRSAAQYQADVRACQAAIAEGDAYVLCLTDTAECEADGVDPLHLYLALRDSGGGIRGGVLSLNGHSLVSVSPERFLSVRGTHIATHPIKGTRPRGDSTAQDAILAEALASDPKERAENLMIVDLMRNDLNQVCEPGTVHTEGFLRVESHPRVHQLVSTVSGTLRAECDALDALVACFPGGSMTGAPKRSAVRLLADLETGPRGLYSGCFGWYGDSGDAELAMSIRCVELRNTPDGAQHAWIGAGGGVTSDSDPEAEHAEKELKAAALIEALRQS